jgi:hypothetical protein
MKNARKKIISELPSAQLICTCTTIYSQCHKKITTRFLEVNCDELKLRHRADYIKFLGDANLQFRQVLGADPPRTEIKA